MSKSDPDLSKTVSIKLPALEMSFPASNRSMLVMFVSLMGMISIVVPLCAFIIFVQSSSENLRSVRDMFNKPEDRHHILTEGDPTIEYEETESSSSDDKIIAPSMELPILHR